MQRPRSRLGGAVQQHLKDPEQSALSEVKSWSEKKTTLTHTMYDIVQVIHILVREDEWLGAGVLFIFGF